MKEELKKFYEYLQERESKLAEKIQAIAKSEEPIDAMKRIEKMILDEKDEVLKEWYKNPKNGRVNFQAMREIVKTSWAKQMEGSYLKALKHRAEGVFQITKFRVER